MRVGMPSYHQKEMSIVDMCVKIVARNMEFWMVSKNSQDMIGDSMQ